MFGHFSTSNMKELGFVGEFFVILSEISLKSAFQVNALSLKNTNIILSPTGKTLFNESISRNYSNFNSEGSSVSFRIRNSNNRKAQFWQTKLNNRKLDAKDKKIRCKRYEKRIRNRFLKLQLSVMQKVFYLLQFAQNKYFLFVQSNMMPHL